ncbi:MAG: hypothetical protein PF482_19265 [Desulfobacteraceae bacterium]|jgi:hypothetical protein|nr:hypothetical protein [Desulfobacteraceae bacterium]
MKVEPRPYRLQIDINPQKSWNINRFCEQLCIIHPESTKQITEDNWGIKGHIELWFQEIDENHFIIHIQKKHSTHKRKYLEQLEELFKNFDRNECIRSYKEIGYSDLI